MCVIFSVLDLHVTVCVCQCVLLCMHYAGAGERRPNKDLTRIGLGSVCVLYGALTTASFCAVALWPQRNVLAAVLPVVSSTLNRLLQKCL